MLVLIVIILIAVPAGIAAGWAYRQMENPNMNPFHGPKNPLRFHDKDE